MSETYSVKMRASSDGRHVSGAEKIVSVSSVSKVASRLVERALSHERGTPDFINVKIEDPAPAPAVQPEAAKPEAKQDAAKPAEAKPEAKPEAKQDAAKPAEAKPEAKPAEAKPEAGK